METIKAIIVFVSTDIQAEGNPASLLNAANAEKHGGYSNIKLKIDNTPAFEKLFKIALFKPISSAP